MKHFIDINNFKKKEIDEIISLAKKILVSVSTFNLEGSSPWIATILFVI